MVAISTATPDRIIPAWSPLKMNSMPPRTMMPLMAFVTLISGVCSAGVTFHTTMYPTKQDRVNTVN